MIWRPRSTRLPGTFSRNTSSRAIRITSATITGVDDLNKAVPRPEKLRTVGFWPGSERGPDGTSGIVLAENPLSDPDDEVQDKVEIIRSCVVSILRSS